MCKAGAQGVNNKNEIKQFVWKNIMLFHIFFNHICISLSFFCLACFLLICNIYEKYHQQNKYNTPSNKNMFQFNFYTKQTSNSFIFLVLKGNTINTSYLTDSHIHFTLKFFALTGPLGQVHAIKKYFRFSSMQEDGHICC